MDEPRALLTWLLAASAIDLFVMAVLLTHLTPPPSLVLISLLLCGMMVLAGGAGWVIVQALPPREARP